jgi:hypothetical protein
MVANAPGTWANRLMQPMATSLARLPDQWRAMHPPGHATSIDPEHRLDIPGKGRRRHPLLDQETKDTLDDRFAPLVHFEA